MKRPLSIVLLGKELRDQVRSYRLLVTALVFLFFGLLSPLSAKFLPELVKMLASGQGISIAVPSPTAAEAMVQYVKNLSQIALLVLVFLAMGAIASEKERGTAAFLLAKPVPRTGVVVAKLGALWILAAAGMVLSALACYLYTAVLFTLPDPGRFLLANLALLVHILTFMSTTLLFSAIANTQVIAGVLSFLAWILLASVGSLGRLTNFLPGQLLGLALSATAGAPLRWEPFAGSAVIIALSVLGAGIMFRRWEP